MAILNTFFKNVMVVFELRKAHIEKKNEVGFIIFDQTKAVQNINKVNRESDDKILA